MDEKKPDDTEWAYERDECEQGMMTRGSASCKSNVDGMAWAWSKQGPGTF